MIGTNKKTYHVQRGNSGTLAISNGRVVCVVEETWEGRRLLNSRIVDSYPDTTQGWQSARAHAAKLETESQ